MYDRQPRYVQIGTEAIAPLLPTAGLRWKNGVLEQWHEATARDAFGGIQTRGEWIAVPQE